MHPFRFGIQVFELPFDGWRERVRWYEQSRPAAASLAWAPADRYLKAFAESVVRPLTGQ